MPHQSIVLRYEVRADDRETVRRLVESTGVFSSIEVDVAVELVDDRLKRGVQSDYRFVFAELLSPALPMNLSAASTPAHSAGTAVCAVELGSLATSESIKGRTVGYTCYGPIALTAASFDLYWIAVDKELHGRKLGRVLLERTEELIHEAGGRQVYIETSNKQQYAPTRGFYLRCGYEQAALLKDFYGPEDDKVIYAKVLQGK